MRGREEGTKRVVSGRGETRRDRPHYFHPTLPALRGDYCRALLASCSLRIR